MTAAYRYGLALAAVVVVQGADGARIIALAPGSEDVPAIDELSVRLWCRRETEAYWVAAAAKIVRRKPDGDIGEGIRAAAKKLGVAVQTDDEIAVEAMTVAARIALEMRKQQQSGKLKTVNQAYRSYRLEAANARGERALRYDAWMQRYREDLVRKAAATLRQL